MDNEHIFYEQIKAIDNSFITHMENNIATFYRIPIHEVKLWKYTDKKKSYIAILYINKKKSEAVNYGSQL